MHERNLVKQAWLEADLYGSNDSKLASFLQHFEGAKLHCWRELVQAIREHYPECKEQLITPIWDTGDKLLRLHVIRAADPECDEDVVIFQKLVQRSRPQKDDTELQALMRVAERRGLLRSRKNSTDPPMQEDLVSAYGTSGCSTGRVS